MWQVWAFALFMGVIWRGMPLAFHVRMIYHVLKALINSPTKVQLGGGPPGVKIRKFETVIPFTCWPDDLDFNFHMNNSSYLKLCDFGRVNHYLRLGVSGVTCSNGGVTMRFKREIGAMEGFDLRTRVIVSPSGFSLVFLGGFVLEVSN